MDRTSLLRVCVANTGVQDWYLSPCVCEDGEAHYDKMFEESVAAGVINPDGSLKAEHSASSKREVKAEVTKTSRGGGKKRKAEDAVEVEEVVEVEG